jgi:hypothetical protein
MIDVNCGEYWHLLRLRGWEAIVVIFFLEFFDAG